jgi:hypothetical protein
MVQTISGRLGNLVYYRNGRTQYARRYVVPCNPDTEAQRNRRELFASAVSVWQNLPLYKKEQWNRRARCRGICGYNLFISDRLKQKNLYAGSSASLGFSSSIDHIQSLSVASVSPAAVSSYPPIPSTESEYYAARHPVSPTP